MNSHETLNKTYCIDCYFWHGVCRLGKTGKTADSKACRLFKPRQPFKILLPSTMVQCEYCGRQYLLHLSRQGCPSCKHPLFKQVKP